MKDLFAEAEKRHRLRAAPLADRMRPRELGEFEGQERILGRGKLLRRAIEADRIRSLILFGPPGTGKTTLARVIARTTRAHFATLNAVMSGVKDIRVATEQADERLRMHGRRTIMFVDEVHRFNKAQQDALLPSVESGTIVFIGATTENPYFEVIKALVSRSRVFEFRPLEEVHLKKLAIRALSDARGYADRQVALEDEALEHLVHTSGGDARSLLNALELAVETTPPGPEGTVHVTLDVAEDSIQQRAVLYDRDGDAHYDTISAFIKSMRGSDPDAALYWMARMLYAGEDPRYILRRMLVFAAEDVGLADPRCLQVAASAAQAFEYVGMPEGQYLLAECCLYLATAPKSNSTKAYFGALRHVRSEDGGAVPDALKDASRDSSELGHGKGYRYPHDHAYHYVPAQYLPSGMLGTYFYEPGAMGFEKSIRDRLDWWRKQDLEAGLDKRSRHYSAEKQRDQ